MIKEVRTGTYIKGEESFNFDFYTDLSASKKVEFVNSVVDILVDGENYNFIIKDLIFDFFIVDVFTNIDTKELMESPFFLNDVEEFLDEINVVDIVKTNVKTGLITELDKAVNLGIEYKTGIHENPLNEALTSLVNTLENKINDVDLDSMMEMATKLNGITDDFTTENIVKAYTSTDIFKRNVAELKEVEK